MSGAARAMCGEALWSAAMAMYGAALSGQVRQRLCTVSLVCAWYGNGEALVRNCFVM